MVCRVKSAGLRQGQMAGPSGPWSSIKWEKIPDQEQLQALSSAGCGKCPPPHRLWHPYIKHNSPHTKQMTPNFPAAHVQPTNCPKSPQFHVLQYIWSQDTENEEIFQVCQTSSGLPEFPFTSKLLLFPARNVLTLKRHTYLLIYLLHGAESFLRS